MLKHVASQHCYALSHHVRGLQSFKNKCEVSQGRVCAAVQQVRSTQP